MLSQSSEIALEKLEFWQTKNGLFWRWLGT